MGPWLNLSQNVHLNFLIDFIEKHGHLHRDLIRLVDDCQFEDTMVDDFVTKSPNHNFEKMKSQHAQLSKIWKQKIRCGNVICGNVNSRNEFKLCSGCKVVSYCSAKCQKYD